MSAGSAQAQPQSSAGGLVYSCVNTNGRIYTDRPIAECIARKPLEMRTTGGALRLVESADSVHEAAERRDRQAASQVEQRRRERALLVRYPNAGTHDRERSEALAEIDAVIHVAEEYVGELREERKKIDLELEFYKGDLSKAPEAVRRRLDYNTQRLKAQNRFIGEKEDEKKRLNARFDDERTRLLPHWTDGGGPSARGGR